MGHVAYPDTQAFQHANIAILHRHEDRPEVLHISPVERHLVTKIIDSCRFYKEMESFNIVFVGPGPHLRERWPQCRLLQAVACYSEPWDQIISPGSWGRERQEVTSGNLRFPPQAAAWPPYRVEHLHRSRPNSRLLRHTNTG